MAEFLLFCFIAWLVWTVAKKLKGGKKPRPKAKKQTQDLTGDFAEGDEIELVGESKYQDNLLALFGPKQKHSIDETVSAELVAEPTNRHDPKAIKCEIGGKVVGYVPRSGAAEIHRLMVNGRVPCLATVRGGWKNDKSEGSYGVTVERQ